MFNFTAQLVHLYICKILYMHVIHTTPCTYCVYIKSVFPVRLQCDGDHSPVNVTIVLPTSHPLQIFSQCNFVKHFVFIPNMFQPDNLDKMTYDQLYQLQKKIVVECSSYVEEQAWTHYGLTHDSVTHAHLQWKKECTLCNNKFYKPCSLKTHLHPCHNVVMKKKSKKLNKYVITCAVCKHTFVNITDINEHNSAGHTKLCTVLNCYAGFTTQHDLDKHIKKQHKILQWKTRESDDIYFTKAQV